MPDIPTAGIDIALSGSATNYGVIVGVNTGTINNIIQVAQVVTSLHQLRAPLADFVGRVGEIERLCAVLRGAAPIAAICGIDGLGKTELALMVANRLRADFPDAQLFISLRGADPHCARESAEALRDAIRAFDTSTQLPNDLESLAAIYRGHLGNRRALVLLDDAVDDAVVRLFLPPAGSALLVTARNRLTLGGQGAVVDLAPFSRDESLALLLDDAPHVRGDQAIEGLIEQCGDLPLAIRILGATLAGNPALTPSRYLERLADEARRFKALQGGEQDVYAVLAIGDDLLACENPSLATRWRMLGVAPAAFEAATVAAIWNEPDADSLDDDLAQLVRRSLLRYDPQTQRYRIHTLLRDIARMRRSTDDDMTARLRHAQHYLAIAREAERRYQAGHANIAIGLALFDAARPHIDMAVAWAAAQATAEANRLCIDYPLELYKLLPLRLAPKEQLAWLDPALAAARRQAATAAEQRIQIALGHAWRDSGDAQRAIACYQAALALARGLGDHYAEGIALAGLALIRQDRSDYHSALELYQQALAIAQEVQNREGAARALVNIGMIHSALGDPRSALKSLAQSLTILRELGNQHLEGIVLNNLGDLYRALGDLPRAIDSYNQGLAIARALGDRYIQGIVLGNLGGAYAANGEHTRAGTCYAQSLTIAREAGDREAESDTAWECGMQMLRRGDQSGALALLHTVVIYEQHAARPSAKQRSIELAKIEPANRQGATR